MSVILLWLIFFFWALGRSGPTSLRKWGMGGGGWGSLSVGWRDRSTISRISTISRTFGSFPPPQKKLHLQAFIMSCRLFFLRGGAGSGARIGCPLSYILIRIHTHTHTHINAQTHTHTYTHTETLTYIHSYTQHRKSQTRTHTHTHTHTHTQRSRRDTYLQLHIYRAVHLRYFLIFSMIKNDFLYFLSSKFD